MRIVIAENQEVIRTGLKCFLQNSEFEIIAEPANGRETLSFLRTLQPDTLLLNLQIVDSGENGVLREIRELSAKTDCGILAYSLGDTADSVQKTLGAGANEVLLRDISRASVLKTLRSLKTRGEKEKSLAEKPALTSRENQVLKQIAQGRSNKEIARTLKISVETVKEHVQNILRKNGFVDRTQAAVWAVRNGLD